MTYETHLRAQLVDALPAHRRRRRHRDRALAGIASVVLVVAVGVGLAASGDDDASTERTDTRPVPTTPASPSSEPTTTAPTTTAPTTLGTEVAPPGGPDLDPAVAAEAQDVVADLLRRLRDGDVVGAAALWTGYPVVLGPPYGTRSELETAMAGERDRLAWLLDDPDPELTVTPSFDFTVAAPVVTVVVDLLGGGRRAAAFLTTVGPTEGFAGIAVTRMAEETTVGPQPGSAVTPGSTVTFATTPTEGGVRAFVDGVEVAAVVDRDALTTTVALPSELGDEVVVTLSVATPELPSAYAVSFTG